MTLATTPNLVVSRVFPAMRNAAKQHGYSVVLWYFIYEFFIRQGSVARRAQTPRAALADDAVACEPTPSAAASGSSSSPDGNESNDSDSGAHRGEGARTLSRVRCSFAAICSAAASIRAPPSIAAVRSSEIPGFVALLEEPHNCPHSRQIPT